MTERGSSYESRIAFWYIVYMIESNSSGDNHTTCTCAEDDMLTFRPLRVGLTGSIGECNNNLGIFIIVNTL